MTLQKKPDHQRALDSRKVATPTWMATAFCLLSTCILGSHVNVAFSAPPKLPRVAPESAGLDSNRLRRIDDLVKEALAKKRMPGCVVAIGRNGKLAMLKAYGNRRLLPQTEPMTTDTVFDLASLTKPIATGTSIMVLLEQGKLRLRNRVASYVPAYAVNDKSDTTITHLLTHQSGLLADNSIKDYLGGRESAMEKIYNLDLRAPVGTKFIYSDVNFILLADLIHKLSGQQVDQFSRDNIFKPLGMVETGYRPAEDLRKRAAPTEKIDGTWRQGVVHDPRAHLLDGVAGHAGLFSTATDLAVYAQMMLGKGQYAGVRILSPPTVSLMTRPYPVSSGMRGLGWDKRTGFSSNRGELMSASAFGHGGFTGTAIWMDPQQQLFVIFLSNRVHPNGKGSVNALAGTIGTVASSAIIPTAGHSAVKPRRVQQSSVQRPAASAVGVRSVLTGIDVLEKEGFKRLTGQRVGLITNQTGINRRGVGTVRLLHEAKNVKLMALFSPEHGLEGKLDIPKIADSKESTTGLKVISLYGKTRRPTSESLRDLDTLVFDIQDIGTRFYTYISTMGNALEAAAENKVRFVVLDRPNPINGVDVQGPMLDAGRESFVAYHRIPVRHGMTAGELARMFVAEKKLKVDLQIVNVEGWRRGDMFDMTGLYWINPSPNMRNLNQALLYPGVGLLETTNLSVGRGTDTPFEVVGAPWIDGHQLATELNALQLAGIRFVPLRFTPDSSKFAQESCGGIQLLITDRSQIQPLTIGLEIARLLRKLYPKAWEVDRYDRLLGNAATLNAVRQGNSTDRIRRDYQSDLQAFRARRAKYLLYDAP